jgi:hypothetical protein
MAVYMFLTVDGYEIFAPSSVQARDEDTGVDPEPSLWVARSASDLNSQPLVATVSQPTGETLPRSSGVTDIHTAVTHDALGTGLGAGIAEGPAVRVDEKGRQIASRCLLPNSRWTTLQASSSLSREHAGTCSVSRCKGR